MCLGLCCLAVRVKSEEALERKLRLPAIFGDHMVLQRNTPLPIWGWAPPGEEVIVRLGRTQVKTKANKDGRWRGQLPPQTAGGPHDLVVATKTEQVHFRDVLFGEVWLCSGQSNMEWPVAAAMNGEREIAAANFPQMRFFIVEKVTSLEPLRDCKGRWEVVSPATVGRFSMISRSQ